MGVGLVTQGAHPIHLRVDTDPGRRHVKGTVPKQGLGQGK